EAEEREDFRQVICNACGNLSVYMLIGVVTCYVLLDGKKVLDDMGNSVTFDIFRAWAAICLWDILVFQFRGAIVRVASILSCDFMARHFAGRAVYSWLEIMEDAVSVSSLIRWMRMEKMSSIQKSATWEKYWDIQDAKKHDFVTEICTEGIAE
ncbi:hypothetical protein CYMTET_30923, partial [Cymbomonas tetramitiformis]